MIIPETLGIYIGIPALVTAAIAAAATRGKGIAGAHPKHYDLGERWTHKPVLWSAVDESTTPGHPSGGHAAIESGAELIGGRASGRW